jgi:methylase of polypeptide subunit release factors
LTGTDISQEALQVAMHNRQQLELPFVKLIQSDWFSATVSNRFDLMSLRISIFSSTESLIK